MEFLDGADMKTTYRDFNTIINQIEALPITTPMDWVWIWNEIKCVYRDFQLDPNYIMNKSLDQVWELLWTLTDTEGYPFKFGEDTLREEIRTWIINMDIVSFGIVVAEEVEDEEEE